MFKSNNLRINLFLVFVAAASSLILYRLFILSVVRHYAYLRTAQAQNENISNILARGNIYLSDKNQEPVLAAANKKFPLAHIVPAEVTEKEKAAEKLSEALNLGKEELIKKIESDSQSLRVIARRLTNDQVEAVKNLKLKGTGVSYEVDRFYPGEKLAANVIGFLGYNAEGRRAGQYGIEEYYDQDLFGASHSGPDQPANVVLTVDKNIQSFVEEKLKTILDKWEAGNGTIIVQEPNSGKILAMADWPTFNSNNYGGSPPEYFLNGSIQEVYEPGSSFKPVTMAAGLDLSKVTPQTSYEDVGSVNISGYTIHNFSERVFGIQTMAQVLEKSINTGIMHVENLIGDDNFLNYVINLGFGQKTGIDLPGETSGDVTNLYSGRKINFLTASFGQGIAVTPLQLINAYSTIANGGKLMRPYLVDKIIKEGGEEITTKPEVVSIPISEKTAVKLQTMLVSVVDSGFDKVRINGYDIAGKTGTAQIPDGSGGYSKDEFIHNFVGFAPAYNAKFVILIKMDKPKGITFAADSLSPVFKEITSFLLNYYNIPPTRQ